MSERSHNAYSFASELFGASAASSARSHTASPALNYDALESNTLTARGSPATETRSPLASLSSQWPARGAGDPSLAFAQPMRAAAVVPPGSQVLPAQGQQLPQTQQKQQAQRVPQAQQAQQAQQPSPFASASAFASFSGGASPSFADAGPRSAQGMQNASASSALAGQNLQALLATQTTPAAGLLFESQSAPPGQASHAAPRVPSPADDSWVYIDFYGQQQGPFSATQMSEWLAYLTPELRVRRLSDDQFVALGVLKVLLSAADPFSVVIPQHLWDAAAQAARAQERAAEAAPNPGQLGARASPLAAAQHVPQVPLSSTLLSYAGPQGGAFSTNAVGEVFSRSSPVPRASGPSSAAPSPRIAKAVTPIGTAPSPPLRDMSRETFGDVSLNPVEAASQFVGSHVDTSPVAPDPALAAAQAAAKSAAQAAVETAESVPLVKAHPQQPQQAVDAEPASATADQKQPPLPVGSTGTAPAQAPAPVPTAAAKMAAAGAPPEAAVASKATKSKAPGKGRAQPMGALLDPQPLAAPVSPRTRSPARPSSSSKGRTVQPQQSSQSNHSTGTPQLHTEGHLDPLAPSPSLPASPRAKHRGMSPLPPAPQPQPAPLPTSDPWKKPMSGVRKLSIAEIKQLEQLQKEKKKTQKESPVAATAPAPPTPASANSSASAVVRGWARPAVRATKTLAEIKQEHEAQAQAQAQAQTQVQPPLPAATTSSKTRANSEQLANARVASRFSVLEEPDERRASPSSRPPARRPGSATASALGSAPAAPSITDAANKARPTDELVHWAKFSFKDMPKDVDQIELLRVFLSLPAGKNAREFIAESIFAYSRSLDGRRFAQDFLDRKKAAEQTMPASETWDDVLNRFNPNVEPQDPSFKVVKKKRTRAVVVPDYVFN